jgi:hypothetical protein
MFYTLSKTDKKEPDATEAIFFTKAHYQGDAYVAYVGYNVDFGKGLKEVPDSLNDILVSVKTGNLCKLELYEDHSFQGDNISLPADSDVPELPLIGLTSFKAELDLDGKIQDELTKFQYDKIVYEKRLEECLNERKELKAKLKEFDDQLKQNHEKLDECEKKSKELKDELDKKKLEEEVKKVKDKLDECEKKGKELKEQLEKSEQEKTDYKDKLDKCENK